MHKTRLSQSGFGVIGIALVVLAIVVAGSAGYFVYKAHHKTPTSTVSTNTNSPAKTKTTTTNMGTAATVTPQGTYLDFTQVGVKLLLNSSE